LFASKLATGTTGLIAILSEDDCNIEIRSERAESFRKSFRRWPD